MEAPEFFHGGYYRSGNPQLQQENLHADDHFIIDDLLDFSNEEAVIGDGGALDNFTANSTDSSTVTVVDSCNSSFSGSHPHFPGDIGRRSSHDAQFSEEFCLPYEELAELEWLSTFTEESFSSEDQEKLQLISGLSVRPEPGAREPQLDSTRANNPVFTPEMITVPGKARSKRSRAAPCNWSSRLLVLSPTTSTNSSEADTVSNSGKKTVGKGAAAGRKKELGLEQNVEGAGAGEGRRCLHCATDKTPQWRTGPMGPKTLCNACGVRYKSGRLVPEYRPAASPTFVLTQHSNSHRKVLELRRQKEMQRAQHEQHYMNGNGVFNVGSSGEEYLIHHHGGPGFRQLI